MYLGWVLTIFLFFTYINKAKNLGKEQEKVVQLEQEIENLKDPEYVTKQKKLMDLSVKEIEQTLNTLSVKTSIKAPRVQLGNLVRAFKSSYVWIQLKDMTTLEITDGEATVSLKVQPDIRKKIG